MHCLTQVEGFLCSVIQADFMEDNMGSTNMKGFGMSLQKNGKVHHAILVEQVRATCRDIFRMRAFGLSFNVVPFFFIFLEFLRRSSRKRRAAVLQPNANWQCCSVWEEVSITDIKYTKAGVLWMYLGKVSHLLRNNHNCLLHNSNLDQMLTVECEKYWNILNI